MRERNGRFGTIRIPWFNGGLFDDDDVLPLHLFEIKDVAEAARLDWSAIEPSIFGTLFERGLDPEKRKQMASLFDPAAAPPLPVPAAQRTSDKGVGIHYTDPATIMKIIEPVVLRPLRREWEEVKAKIEAEQAKAEAAETDAARTRHRNAAREAYSQFRERLGRFRVLDPACGSGNFLYLSLWHLKDLDKQVLEEAKRPDMPPDDQRVTPQTVLGIEINEYAAELARVTIWIGELQWQLRNGFGIQRSPILGVLNGIACRDALLNADGSEAEWPPADGIVGNPPFLGNKRMIRELGEDYVTRLRSMFHGRVPGSADLVTYWFEKARAASEAGRTQWAGLVATNSFRGGASRKVLDRICDSGVIFDAWSDEPWVLDGAAVRVSLVNFAPEAEPIPTLPFLNGQSVSKIAADLTAKQANLIEARRLPENQRAAFQGPVLVGRFDIAEKFGRAWLAEPVNPNGRPNSDVLKPLVNGKDITSRSGNRWVINFGMMPVKVAAIYEKPFEYIEKFVKPNMVINRRERRAQFWWQHGETGVGWSKLTLCISRYIATSQVSKHRFFVWISSIVQPHQTVTSIARDDDTTFGILHSRFHELWSLRLGTSLEDRPRYTPTTTFETFPFPEGLTPNIPAAQYADDPRAIRIADVSRRLNELRENWLNPPIWSCACRRWYRATPTASFRSTRRQQRS